MSSEILFSFIVFLAGLTFFVVVLLIVCFTFEDQFVKFTILVEKVFIVLLCVWFGVAVISFFDWLGIRFDMLWSSLL